MGKPDASDEEVEQAAVRSGCAALTQNWFGRRAYMLILLQRNKRPSAGSWHNEQLKKRKKISYPIDILLTKAPGKAYNKT